MCSAFYFILRQLQGAKRTPFSDTRRFPSQALAEEYRRLQKLAEDYRNYMGRRGEIES